MSALRALWPLLALALLLPTAAAEGELVVSVDTAALEPFTLQEQRAPVLVDVDCSVFAGVPPTITVEVSVADAPSWLEAFVEQATLSASPTQCIGGRIELPTELRMFWKPGGETPIAGYPYGLRVVAAASDVQGNAFEAEAPVEVRAGLMGNVRVAPGEGPATVAPGQVAQLTRVAINDYNAPVTFEWVPDAASAARGVGVLRTTVEPGERGVAVFTLNVPQQARDQSTLDVHLAWTATAQEQQVGAGNETISLHVVAPQEGSPTRPATGSAEEPASPPTSPSASPAASPDARTPPAPLALILFAVLALARATRRT